MSNIERFNTQLYDFITQMYSLYPNDKNISSLKKKVYYGKLSQCDSMCKEFKKTVIPHCKQILSRDINYLLSIENNFLDRFKKYFISETEHNKKIIMDYLCVLVLLCQKIELRI